jgi:hypothetical protein
MNINLQPTLTLMMKRARRKTAKVLKLMMINIIKEKQQYKHKIDKIKQK